MINGMVGEVAWSEIQPDPAQYSLSHGNLVEGEHTVMTEWQYASSLCKLGARTPIGLNRHFK